MQSEINSVWQNEKYPLNVSVRKQTNCSHLQVYCCSKDIHNDISKIVDFIVIYYLLTSAISESCVFMKVGKTQKTYHLRRVCATVTVCGS